MGQERSPRRRCATSGCGRFIGRDDDWCPAHRDSEASTKQIAKRAIDSDAATTHRPASLAATGRRQRTRSTTSLHSRLESDLAGEIGALRLAMARLLAEETDPGRLAQGVARVAVATIQAVRAQRALEPDHQQSVTAAVVRFLAELDAPSLAAIDDALLPIDGDERVDLE
ncbi:MAG: hypothetical protein M3354_06655 [Chloroflexota bacterium]|nr:hypothetical protein [Chloroflexota bacterium]